MKIINGIIVYLVTLSFALISLLAPICNAADSKKPEIITFPTCCSLNLSSTGKCENINTGKIYSWKLPSHLISTQVSTEIRLQYKVSECKNQGNIVVLPLENLLGKEISSPEHFLPDGYLKMGNEYYPRQEYCINGTTGNKTVTELILKVCEPSCGERTPCIKKCCHPHQLMSVGLVPGSRVGCVDRGHHDPYIPTLYRNYDTKLSDKESQNIFPHFSRYNPKWSCNKTIIFTPYAKTIAEAYKYYRGQEIDWKNYRLTKNGYVMYRTTSRGKCNKIFHADENMCFDGVINYSENATRFRNEEEETLYANCAVDEAQKKGDFSDISPAPVYGTLLLSSSIFAFLTILVYLLLWKKQNFRGWIIVSQALSLFFTNIFLGTGHIIKINFHRDILDTPGCIFVGYATHFFFLSMFCWITVTGFDLWMTFRELKPSHSESEGRKRLILYSAFAWGVPTIFVTVGGILQNIADDTNCGDSDMDSRIVTPGYGMEQCYLSSQAFGIYLYYPATAMMTVNLIFFCVTIYKFYKYRKGTRMATKDESLKQFYMLSIKLFVVMGVTWIMEIFSFYHDSVGQTWYWVLFDVLNCLRPIAFFVIFVCKPDIIAALQDNYACLKPLLKPCSKAFHKKTARSDSENVTMTTGISTKRSFSESQKLNTNACTS